MHILGDPQSVQLIEERYNNNHNHNSNTQARSNKFSHNVFLTRDAHVPSPQSWKVNKILY